MKKLSKRINKIIFSTKTHYFLLFLILLGGFVVRLYKINNPIADWHSWRQVDTAAVARIYVDQGINILYPRYYDISSIQTGFYNPEGFRFVEFPIYNIFHAVLYKNIPSISFEAWGRLVSIVSSLITALALYFIAKRYLGKWGGLTTTFLFCFIPFNIYFSRVILPEPMATMFAIVSVWLFIVYTERDSKLVLFISAFSFSASLLLKPFTLFYALPLIYLAWKKFGIRGILKNVPLLLAIDVALIPVFMWRAWMNVNANFVGIPHLAWAFNGDGIRFRPAFWRWIFGERLGNLILGGWGLILFVYGLLAKPKKSAVMNLMIFGMFLYVSTIATASIRHDYYQTIAIPAIVLVVANGVVSLWNTQNYSRLISRSIVIFSLGMMFGMGAFQVKEYYKINHPEFIEVGKIVDESIPKDAWVIVPDNGNTVFLYYTKRYGWPVLEGNIDEFVRRGADYFISVNNDQDTNMMKNKFEVFKEGPNYWIIDLNKPKK